MLTATAGFRHDAIATARQALTSLGSSSARVQASVLDLYDPDRSQTVLKRGERSSWADLVGAWKERAKLHAADAGAGLAELDLRAVVVGGKAAPVDDDFAAHDRRRRRHPVNLRFVAYASHPLLTTSSKPKPA